MGSDKYTKAILTVIAIMLTVIVIKTAVSPSGASPKQPANGSGANAVAEVPPISVFSKFSERQPPKNTGMSTHPPTTAPPYVSGHPPTAPIATAAAPSLKLDGDCAIPLKDPNGFGGESGTGCAVRVMKPSHAVQILQDELEFSSRGFGRLMHPNGTPPDLRTYDERMRDEAERMKQINGPAPRPGTMTVTPNDAPPLAGTPSPIH